MSLLIPSFQDRHDALGHLDVREWFAETVAKALQDEKTRDNFKWSFEVVPGFFAQSDEKTDDLKFNYAFNNIGRLKSWGDLIEELKELNRHAKPNEVFKLVTCARHGEGFHNMVVDKYGIQAWSEKWSHLNTDGELEYGPDAMLSAKGIEQARQNHEVWEKEIKEHGAPLPDKFYVSPLQRSMWTLQYTWENLRSADQKALIVEKLRERYGSHTCNKRNTKSIIEKRFLGYGYEFEDGFLEEDVLHTDEQESHHHHCVRTNDFCQELFEKDWDSQANAVDREKALANAFISTTSHAGTISELLTVFNHRPFAISTGGMIPVVVKATRRID
ncbi:hypothetical protein C7M61_000661 [Candidozyma pseudohaemuli]|uniref:Phosphoglycerate mutase n=1 Tax=Candidozyma pseudohaemuli TaxID=418784 RepID=A0A2P7YYG3_9ASCO|nr:hypothetical protein C7M61_000661 [[Candida] pseudohaemulonii]PSK40994.1 hypothetical protein C7M61_000661 [[Candida] pseudohaemulonii]